MSINIATHELKVREKTQVLLAFDEEGEIVEKTITVYHKPLFDQELFSQILEIQFDETEGQLPKTTRQLLAMDAQSFDTVGADGKRAKWTPESLKKMPASMQQIILDQITEPLAQRMKRAQELGLAQVQKEPLPERERQIVAFDKQDDPLDLPEVENEGRDNTSSDQIGTGANAKSAG